MAGIGHNSASLSAAAQANVETGVWLLCKEFLVTAIQDRRLERGHLRVLACFATLVNRNSAKAWPDRVTIAAMAGMTPHAVSTAIGELKRFGYLISDREPVDLAGGKTLTVYTFGNIDHDTIRREISAFVDTLKLRRKQSPPKETVSAHGERTSPPTGTMVPPPRGTSPYTGTKQSPPTGNSNSIEEELLSSAAVPRKVRATQADQLREKLLQIGGNAFVNPVNASGLLQISAIIAWLDAGADPDADIIPAVRAVCVRSAERRTQQIRTWDYFNNAVSEALDRRRRGLPKATFAGNAGAPTADEENRRLDGILGGRK